MEVARSPFGDFEQAPSKEKFRETVAEDYYSANTRDDAGGQSLENALKLHFPKPLMRKVRTSRRHLLAEKELSMIHGTLNNFRTFLFVKIVSENYKFSTC